MKLESIAISESRRLLALEETIAAGRKSFMEVGAALAEIRDSRLYRADFSTFQDYCRAKWSWDKSYCHRLITAAETAKTVPNGDITNEGQARALKAVPAEKRAEVLAKAKASGKVSGPSIRAAAQDSPSGSDDPPSRETHSNPSAGGLSGVLPTPSTEPERISDDPPHVESTADIMAEYQTKTQVVHECAWTHMDFTLELAGLLEKAEHFITTKGMMLDCALALYVAHKRIAARYESMKA